MSPPVGQAGCSATAEGSRPFALALAYGFSDTKLVFLEHGRHRFRQEVWTLSFVGALKDGTVLGVAIGPNAGGRIDGLRGVEAGEQWEIRPGFVWALTVARRWFGTRPESPFLLVVGTLSGSSTSTVRASDRVRGSLHAFDIKGDVSFGWTLGEAFSPYLAVRMFGGPVLWRERDASETAFGTDLYHVSLACGFNLSLDDRFSLFFDGAFVGARGLGGGAGVRF